MAFSPDVKTISRNIYLQQKLSVTCDFLEKEKSHFKKRYEEKQRECLNVLKRLHSDSKRFGIPVQPVADRPFTCSAHALRSRSQSVSVGTNGQGSSRLRSYRPRSSSQVDCNPKNGYVKNMKVYTFQKVECDNPDTEAFTVYCHNPTRRASVGTPVSQINDLVPSALSNYTSDIKWNDVKTISKYMNRSERRHTMIDARTPIVLADVGRLRPSDFKQRSMSYSGPSRATRMSTSEPAARQRSATVSIPYMHTRGRNIGVHTKEETSGQNPCQSVSASQPASGPQTSPDVERLTDVQPRNDRETFLLNPTASKVPTLDDSEECKDPCNQPSDSVNVNEVDKSHKESVESKKSQSPQVSSLSKNRRFSRRVSAPEVKSNYDRGRIARSSHEARMQRRLSHGRQPSAWLEEETTSNDSDNDEFERNDCDSDAYVQKEVSSFMSKLKCSDILEDRITSYLSAVGKAGSLNHGTRDSPLTDSDNLPFVAKPGKDSAGSATSVEKKKSEKPLTNRRLADMMKRPQRQLQMLLNKIRDVNRAVERADRMRPKLIKPKCTF